MAVGMAATIYRPLWNFHFPRDRHGVPRSAPRAAADRSDFIDRREDAINAARHDL